MSSSRSLTASVSVSMVTVYAFGACRRSRAGVMVVMVLNRARFATGRFFSWRPVACIALISLGYSLSQRAIAASCRSQTSSSIMASATGSSSCPFLRAAFLFLGDLGDPGPAEAGNRLRIRLRHEQHYAPAHRCQPEQCADDTFAELSGKEPRLQRSATLSLAQSLVDERESWSLHHAIARLGYERLPLWVRSRRADEAAITVGVPQTDDFVALAQRISGNSTTPYPASNWTAFLNPDALAMRRPSSQTPTTGEWYTGPMPATKSSISDCDLH